MNRRLAILLIVPLLASCTLDDAVEALGPRPDSDIAELADQAAADATALVDVPSQLRQRHSNELVDEIARLCGTHSDGSVPDSCDFSLSTETRLTGDLSGSLALTLDSVEEVPEESVDLVVRQAVELAQITPLDGSESFALDEDADSARRLLKQEYAGLYGLGIARAFLPSEAHGALDDLVEVHEERALSLRTLLDPSGDVPVAEPGYEIEGAGMMAPTDTASAAAFVERLHTDIMSAWLSEAAHSASREWLEWTVLGASDLAASWQVYEGTSF